jgi:hypothetical protein
MSEKRAEKREPKQEKKAEKKAAETVNLSAEELRKISGGTQAVAPPKPGSGGG